MANTSMGEIISTLRKEKGMTQKDIADNLDEQARKEWDFKVRQHRDEVSIAKASIRAVRDIGVAYAENQPAVVYHTYGWWW